MDEDDIAQSDEEISGKTIDEVKAKLQKLMPERGEDIAQQDHGRLAWVSPDHLRPQSGFIVISYGRRRCVLQ